MTDPLPPSAKPSAPQFCPVCRRQMPTDSNACANCFYKRPLSSKSGARRRFSTVFILLVLAPLAAIVAFFSVCGAGLALVPPRQGRHGSLDRDIGVFVFSVLAGIFCYMVTVAWFEFAKRDRR